MSHNLLWTPVPHGLNLEEYIHTQIWHHHCSYLPNNGPGRLPHKRSDTQPIPIVTPIVTTVNLAMCAPTISHIWVSLMWRCAFILWNLYVQPLVIDNVWVQNSKTASILTPNPVPREGVNWVNWPRRQWGLSNIWRLLDLAGMTSSWSSWISRLMLRWQNNSFASCLTDWTVHSNHHFSLGTIPVSNINSCHGQYW